MSELRQDRTSGRWVLIAPERAHRLGALQPGAQSSGAAVAPALPFDPDCPFCPGHESDLPGILAETHIDGTAAWSVRAVPNKYPAVELSLEIKGRDQHHVAEGYGFHEVIVESPRHDADLARMTDSEIEAVVAMYRDRTRDLMVQRRIEAVVLFRNHGSRSGASQPHPHAQIIALDVVPPRLAALADWGDHYYCEHGRCATCDEIAIETDLKTRIVEDGQDFIVLVPFAGEHPCEMWILPKAHRASFLDLADSEIREVARLLRHSLHRLRSVWDDPPYNFVIDSAARGHLSSAYVHWRLRIAPDLAKWGGFELGAGMAINPSLPEDDADILRAVALNPGHHPA